MHPRRAPRIAIGLASEFVLRRVPLDHDGDVPQQLEVFDVGVERLNLCDLS